MKMTPGANKEQTTMTPIIDRKTRFSSFKRHAMVLSNILLVGCYVGMSLGRNYMAYI